MLAPSLDQVSRSPALYLVLGIGCLLLAGYAALNAAPAFDQRAIGVTVLHGIDASRRNLVYILCVLGAVSLLLSLLLRLRPVDSGYAVTGEAAARGPALVFVLLANVLLYLYYDAPVFLAASAALLFLLALGLVFRRLEGESFYSSYAWILLALIFQGLMTTSAVTGYRLQFGVTYFLLAGLLLAILTCLTRRSDNTNSPGDRPLLLAHALFPLMLAPLAVIAANELHYLLGQRYGYAGSALPVWLALCSVLVLAVLFRLLRGPSAKAFGKPADSRVQLDHLLVTRYLPLVLASSVAFSEYTGANTGAVDLFLYHDFFHAGEAIVPVQQIMQFGSIPYIDFFPTHGVFDILPQLFYQLAHQGDYIESILWGEGYGLGWLPRMLSVLAMYWLLQHFLGYRVAFLVLMFLPVYHLLHPYYVILYLPLFALALGEGGFGRWLAFWFLLLLVFLWRIDFGITALAGCLFVLGGWLWSQRDGATLGRCAGAAAVVLGLSGAAFGLLAVSGGKSPLDALQQFLAYVQLQTPLGAREHIIRGLDFAAILQYVLLPLTGAFVAAYFLSTVLNRSQPGRELLLLAFLAAASLVISIRSLARHSHYDGIFNPYFFALLLALAPGVILALSRSARALLFVLVCVATYIYFPLSSSPYSIVLYRPTLAQEYPYPAGPGDTRLTSTAPPQGRLSESDSGAVPLTRFLRHYLKDDETFYDFSNSPLLYALSRKRLPTLTMETFYHAAEPVQTKVLEDLYRQYEQGLLPLVLFGRYPVSNAWNAVDGVNREMRSYRVAEFIYRHYRPCARIGNHEVWLAANRQGSTDCVAALNAALADKPEAAAVEISPVERYPQQFNIRKLPYVWANYDPRVESLDCAAGERVVITLPGESAVTAHQLALPARPTAAGPEYLYLQISAEQDTRARLEYAGGNRFEFDIVASQEPRSYLIRVSSQYAWHQETVDNMTLSHDGPIALSCAAVVPGD